MAVSHVDHISPLYMYVSFFLLLTTPLFYITFICQNSSLVNILNISLWLDAPIVYVLERGLAATEDIQIDLVGLLLETFRILCALRIIMSALANVCLPFDVLFVVCIFFKFFFQNKLFVFIFTEIFIKINECKVCLALIYFLS